MKSVVKYLPSTSALARSVHGSKAEWSAGEYLLAAAVDVLQVANWQRAQAGSKGRVQRPTPLPRPGDVTVSKPAGMPLVELRALLARHNPHAFPN